MKAWKMQKKYGLMREFSETNFEPFDGDDDPLEVYAAFDTRKNMMKIKAAYLQKPFYFRGLEALNYGAIGSILGHELTHGFDDFSHFLDRHDYDTGYLNFFRQFTDRSNCFIKQYSNFNVTNGKKLDGQHTLRENIADNGGLRESYNAYQTYKKKYGPELKLPGFEEFSHEQLLFLSFGTSWCKTIKSEFQGLFLDDVHSPARVRVIATLQNMEEFANAFQCPSGSFMNPTNKCIIW